MEEIWKNVKNFEGYYQISNRGRVRRIRPTTNCDIEIIRYLSLKKYNNQRNIVVQLSKPGNYSKAYNLNSLVYDHFFPEKEGMKFKHKDKNLSNCCIDNFVHLDYKRINTKRGSNNQLTEKVKRMHKNKITVKDIAKDLNLTENAIRYHINK